MTHAEHPFTWTCPHCHHRQGDTLNAEQGPFLNVTCSACQKTIDRDDLSSEDQSSWDAAEARAVKNLPACPAIA